VKCLHLQDRQDGSAPSQRSDSCITLLIALYKSISSSSTAIKRSSGGHPATCSKVFLDGVRTSRQYIHIHVACHGLTCSVPIRTRARRRTAMSFSSVVRISHVLCGVILERHKWTARFPPLVGKCALYPTSKGYTSHKTKRQNPQQITHFTAKTFGRRLLTRLSCVYCHLNVNISVTVRSVHMQLSSRRVGYL